MIVSGRDIVGYLVGLVLFIICIPALMWKLSGAGETTFEIGKVVILILFAAVGIALSIWSIIYMRVVGKGNPMDAFNNEIAPRTTELMTDGPYKICRNPMLLGVFIYYIGILIYLRSWQALVIFVIYFCIMMIQVKKEEQRLETDFGEEYLAYKKKTKKLIPYIW